VAFALIGGIAASCFQSRAESIRIRVLDARNGRPIRNEVLQIWIDIQGGMAKQARTNALGIATVNVERSSVIYVASNYYVDCRYSKKTGQLRYGYSVSEILSTGKLAANTCSKMSPEPNPGELIFFVRPERWWEGMRR
jgi:hypothetical protein